MVTLIAPRKVVATATVSATLARGAHTPADATSGALTMTLPTLTPVGVEVSVEKVDASANSVTISGTIRGGVSSLTLTSQYEARTFLSEGGGSWRPISDHRTAASLSAAYAPMRATAPDPTVTKAYIDTSVTPPALKGWNGTAWVAIGGGSGGTTTQPAAPANVATIAVAAGAVSSALTGFPVRVNLADLGTSFWSGITTTGSNIRVKSGTTDLPFDLVRIDTINKTGELFFRADLTGSAQAFTIGGTSGAVAPAVTDPLGRNAVWADFDTFYAGGDGIDRTGGGTLTNQIAGAPFFTAKSISPDVVFHQGIERDPRGFWYAFDTNGITKYDLNWNVVNQNLNPIGEMGIANVSHIGDSCIVGTELFMPVQKWPTTVYNNQWIVVFDADTLKFKRKHDFSAVSIDPSGLGLGPDGKIYAPNWGSANTMEVFTIDQAAGTCVRGTPIALTGIFGPQGITYANGFFWITGATNDTLYRVNLDGTSTRIVESGMSTSRNGAILEGITHDPTGKLHLFWADSPSVGSRIWEYAAKGDRLEYDAVAYDVLAPVSKWTQWTLGVSFRPWRLAASGLPRRIVGYGSSDNTSTNTSNAQILQSTGGFYALQNSTNGLLESSVVPALGTRVRLHQRQNAATARELWVNGALAISGATAQRPIGLGDRMTLGNIDGGVATNAIAGAVDYVYLRNGLMSTAWLAAEQANWESSGFYTVSG